MSSTIIVEVRIGEVCRDFEELPNSYGSAPHVWDAIGTKHLGPGHYACQTRANQTLDLVLKKKIPHVERVMFLMTCDFAYIEKSNYARAAQDIREFLDVFKDYFASKPNAVNHWPKIAEIFESDPDIPAIGFYWTTVGNDWWEGPWDRTTRKRLPLDWSKAWELYSKVDE